MRAPFARFDRARAQVQFGQADASAVIDRDDLPEALVALFDTLTQTMPLAGNLQRWQRDHLIDLHQKLALYLLNERPTGEAKNVDFEVYNHPVFGLRAIRNSDGDDAYLFLSGNITNDPNAPLDKLYTAQASPHVAGEWIILMAEQLFRGTYRREHARKLYDLAGTVVEQDNMALGTWAYRSGLMGAVHVMAMDRMKPSWHEDYLPSEEVKTNSMSAELRNRIFSLESRPAQMGALEYEAALHANADVLAKTRVALRSQIRRNVIDKVEGVNAANVHVWSGKVRSGVEYEAHIMSVLKAVQGNAIRSINDIWHAFSETITYAYGHLSGNPDLLPPLAEDDVNAMCGEQLSMLMALCFDREGGKPYVTEHVLTKLDDLIDILWDVAARNCLHRNQLSAIVIGGSEHLTYADLNQQYLDRCFLVPVAEPRDRV
jgi:hypothetical protein